MENNYKVFCVLDSCRFTRATERVTPRIVVDPPDIAEGILLAA